MLAKFKTLLDAGLRAAHRILWVSSLGSSRRWPQAGGGRAKFPLELLEKILMESGLVVMLILLYNGCTKGLNDSRHDN
jgi:hypothetical protein